MTTQEKYNAKNNPHEKVYIRQGAYQIVVKMDCFKFIQLVTNNVFEYIDDKPTLDTAFWGEFLHDGVYHIAERTMLFYKTVDNVYALGVVGDYPPKKGDLLMNFWVKYSSDINDSDSVSEFHARGSLCFMKYLRLHEYMCDLDSPSFLKTGVDTQAEIDLRKLARTEQENERLNKQNILMFNEINHMTDKIENLTATIARLKRSFYGD